MTASTRKKGMKKTTVGIVALVAVSYFIVWLQGLGYTPNSFALIGLGAPVAIGFVGFLEMIMNRLFSEMEDWWGGLKGWQRGMLGLLVVMLAFAALIGGMATAGVLGLI